MTVDKNQEDKHSSTDITDFVGGFGPWQLGISIVFFFGCFLPGCHNLSVTFLAPEVDHWCAPPAEFRTRSTEWKNISIPIELRNGKEVYSQCEKFRFDNETDISQNVSDILTEKCSRWQYDKSFYSSTVVEQFNLVCDREWLLSLTKSVYMSGSLLSVIVLGHLSDRVGRRPIILMGVFLFLVAGILCAFSTSFVMFTILRFFVAVGSYAIFTSGCVIVMEIVSSDYRPAVGLAFQLGWPAAFILLAGVAWLLRNWVHLQLALTVPFISMICIWWLVPESPRWLLTQGKKKEFKAVLEKAAHKNKKNIEDLDAVVEKICLHAEKQKSDKRHTTALDLLKPPSLRSKTLNLYFCWFVNSFMYYGIALNTNDLSGDPFVNFIILSVVEFPAVLVAIYSIKYLGRRMALFSAMIGGGTACVLMIAVPADMIWLIITLATTGKFCVTASFGIIYLYSAEIFPTVARNAGIGSCSMFSKVGSTIAPFVKELGDVTNASVPMALYGGLSILSALLVLLLPETKHWKAPDTLEEAEYLSRNKNMKPQEKDISMNDVFVKIDKESSNNIVKKLQQ